MSIQPNLGLEASSFKLQTKGREAMCYHRESTLWVKEYLNVFGLINDYLSFGSLGDNLTVLNEYLSVDSMVHSLA